MIVKLNNRSLVVKLGGYPALFPYTFPFMFSTSIPITSKLNGRTLTVKLNDRSETVKLNNRSLTLKMRP